MVRDLLKTLSFASLHFAVGFGVTYALTGSVAIATGVALIEPTVNTVVFFFHERLWARFPAKIEAHGGHGYRHGIDQPQSLPGIPGLGQRNSAPAGLASLLHQHA